MGTVSVLLVRVGVNDQVVSAPLATGVKVVAHEHAGDRLAVELELLSDFSAGVRFVLNSTAEGKTVASEGFTVSEFVWRQVPLHAVLDVAEEGVALACFAPPAVLQAGL